MRIDLKWWEMQSKVIFGHPKWANTPILVFIYFQEDRCFSLIHGEKHKTLDLIADDKNVRDAWVHGLKHLKKKLSEANLSTQQNVYPIKSTEYNTNISLLVFSRVQIFMTGYSRCFIRRVTGYSSILGLFLLPKKCSQNGTGEQIGRLHRGIPTEDWLIESGHITASIYYDVMRDYNTTLINKDFHWVNKDWGEQMWRFRCLRWISGKYWRHHIFRYGVVVAT